MTPATPRIPIPKAIASATHQTPRPYAVPMPDLRLLDGLAERAESEAQDLRDQLHKTASRLQVLAGEVFNQNTAMAAELRELAAALERIAERDAFATNLVLRAIHDTISQPVPE